MTSDPDADPENSQSAKDDSPRTWYSNTIWRKRQEDDDALFEVMSLQVFQAGLTWSMVLERRDAFRNAFRGWKVDEVSDMGPDAVDRLVEDASIIRNRRKIEACIANARSIQSLKTEHGSFCHWFYHVLPGNNLAELQAILRKTFKFMGPEIARMWLLASGRLTGDE
ncbi:MAG: DNA-3-methyladenine glycosylase I [Chloroflexi bacterium]|nr:DNA-3-methyladenine glycosylase I [Chloroflexota bacterium]